MRYHVLPYGRFSRRDSNERATADTGGDDGAKTFALLNIERMRQPTGRVALFSYWCATLRTEFR